SIEGVEEVPAKLDAPGFGEVEAFENGDILVARAEGSHIRKKHSEIAERERARDSKRVAIQQHVSRLTGEAVQRLELAAARTDPNRFVAHAIWPQMPVEDRQSVRHGDAQRRCLLIFVDAGHRPSAEKL